ncbi:hypothetical protein K437DRAFT_74193 [Tilletiaria anomala UBC 951]|uniref:Domain of unknown function at the cortex 1 domain-containing protein n=1 Tax=Tilletiaria anomala (strain ATCC 24038 / CBS 436.72 / UBC 951) TaxID=1037660 RepID=A0A066WGV9_TILAU|nr:uncharacterized protein K437DRAFT_74193 [Tilletiaria anomala UBC 951]KDN49940.1 hypothetical protein K437DRAFT_74193 [Tilletiaria anomala UBC 951]
MPRLLVKVGPDREHMEVCRLNDMYRPHEINSEHFVGRVLVRIINAPGANEGEEGREYFQDRSRKFSIQIEGRFKKPWKGSEVLFGSDFDKWIAFPRAPFTAGMRVAQMIDPCTFYDEHPPSGRPYIMSPYCACMNTLCAWPAPSRAHDAVVVLRHAPGPHTHVTGSLATQGGGGGSALPHHAISPNSGAQGNGSPMMDLNDQEKKPDGQASLVASPPGSDNEGDGEDDGDVVPVESLERKKKGAEANGEEVPAAVEKPKRRSWFGGFGGGPPKEERKLKKYWRFVGFKQDPRVRAFLEAHHASLDKLDRQPSRSGRGTPRPASSAHTTGAPSTTASANVSAPGSTRMSPATSMQGSAPGHVGGAGSASADGSITASPVIPSGYVLSNQGGVILPPERPFSPGSASGQNKAAGTIATGAINMPLLHRLGTGLRDQGGKTPEPPSIISPSLMAQVETVILREPSPLRQEQRPNSIVNTTTQISATPALMQAAAVLPPRRGTSSTDGVERVSTTTNTKDNAKEEKHHANSKPTRKISLHNPLKVLKPKAALHALNFGKKDDSDDEEEMSAPPGKKSHSRSSSITSVVIQTPAPAPAQAQAQTQAQTQAPVAQETTLVAEPAAPLVNAAYMQHQEAEPALQEFVHAAAPQQPQPQPVAEHEPQCDVPLGPPLQRITTSVRQEMEKFAQGDGLTEGDFRLADRLRQTHLTSPPPPPSFSRSGHGRAANISSGSDHAAGIGASVGVGATAPQGGESDAEWHSTLDEELGPWRFSDPGTDMIEDNAFIFTHESVSVPRRRKYFADAKHREDFVYDPDVVYGSAFFSDMMDFNTFDLHIGPVRINVHRFFKDMPVRYTLRAANDESITFCTISFELV